MAPPDPRYRAYRAALWAIWFAILAFTIGSVVVSTVRHLSGPHRPPATGALPTRASMRVCVQELEALQREQNERAWQLGSEVGTEGAVARFESWSRDWEQRVADLGDRCRLDATDPDPQGFGGRRELAEARDAVLALHRLYRAQVNRFTGEGVELARAATVALEKARAAAAPRP